MNSLLIFPGKMNIPGFKFLLCSAFNIRLMKEFYKNLLLMKQNYIYLRESKKPLGPKLWN